MVELVMFLFFFLQGGIVQTVIWLVLGMWRGGGNTIFDALGSDLRVSIPSGYYIVAFSKKCRIMVCQNAFISRDCVPARMNCYRTQSRVDPLPFTSAPQSSLPQHAAHRNPPTPSTLAASSNGCLSAPVYLELKINEPGCPYVTYTSLLLSSLLLSSLLLPYACLPPQSAYPLLLCHESPMQQLPRPRQHREQGEQRHTCTQSLTLGQLVQHRCRDLRHNLRQEGRGCAGSEQGQAGPGPWPTGPEPMYQFPQWADPLPPSCMPASTTHLLASSPSTAAAAPPSRGHSGQGGAQLCQLLRGAAQKLQHPLQGRIVQVGLAQA